MLEVGIIICLAIALFLALKNFSKTGQNISGQKNKRIGFFAKYFIKNQKKVLEDIREEIEKSQEVIMPPVEINEAKEKFNEEDPELAQSLRESEEAYEKGDLRQAEELAIFVLNKNKRSAFAYNIIGRVAFSRGALDDAKEAFKAALKCDKELSDGHFGLGLVEFKDENYAVAIEHFQRAVMLDRGVAQWYAELGKAHMEVRQFAKAAKALKRAASLDIDNKEYKELASEAEDKQRAHATVLGRK